MSMSPPSGEVMNITSMVDKRNPALMGNTPTSITSTGDSPEHHLLAHSQIHTVGIDQADSPHGSESSYHSARATPLEAFGGLSNGQAYGASSISQASASMSASGVPMGMIPISVATGVHSIQIQQYQPIQEAPQPPAKSYPCSTCAKGFARRSDLARHERIHSGVRPHVCDFDGCGKQFIQRSALTVHQRVHTGEKPHMCERCGKPFSDSSSLARHRRIHSGKRPYKCPYADCQKTFTRRTTLTRHQNHHSGTVEEAAAATAKLLAKQAGNIAAQSVQGDGGDVGSNHESAMNNTASPAQRLTSMSPSSDLTATNTVRNNDLSYLSNGSMSGHLRSDGSAQTPVSAPGYATGMRPTSHPNGFPQPPATLEPNVDSQQQSSMGSSAGSPHVVSVDWHSPSHMTSPTHSNSGNSFVYPDPDQSYHQANGLGHMYFAAGAQVTRQDSNEPAGSTSYDVKPQPNELWAGGQ